MSLWTSSTGRVSLLEAICEQERRRSKKRRWRKRLCWLLGHEKNLIVMSTPIILEPSDDRDPRTTAEYGCLWCRKHLGEEKK